jgi:hypothetical protein
MYHEMDIQRIILMNQHLNFEISLHYQSVVQVDYEFLMTIETEEKKNSTIDLFFDLPYVSEHLLVDYRDILD